ncbi:Campylo_MOMP domain-containing protein [Aliarcobacter faecis]|uniref:major outer membrane protein n=1 Tax=Aliarcobacter faecis TaxID=1564138 RepID=UPI000479E7CF|nr:major outer membrane protein [Aliarcobacter faecis]QKF74125.1 Campylo_MOMP domain-containing protein [Aliarcobacter faecis]
MRKISKLSLVAAVAVAGFSTANAQPLEEAIKNVEVSGSVVYRYDNFHNDNKYSQTGNTDSGKNNYKVGLNLSSKVNDYVKFNSRFLVAGADSGFAGLDAKTDSDSNVETTLSNAYFGLTAIPNTVVNVGKQGLATPYTVAVDINGNEQNGTGVLALTTVDVVTLGAGAFNQTNLDKTNDINAFNGDKGSTLGLTGNENLYVATVQGNLDFVKLEAWYLGLEDTFNSYTLAATGNIDLAQDAKIGLEARYVNLKLDSKFVPGASSDDRKNDMFRLAADGKFSIVNARLAYTQTGKHGGLTAVDQDAKNTSLGWALSSNNVDKAKYWQAALGADILDNLNFTVNYGNLKSKENYDNIKQQEVYGQLTYKMSKNFTTYLRYGNVEEKEYSTGDKTISQDRGRVQVAYTF